MKTNAPSSGDLKKSCLASLVDCQGYSCGTAQELHLIPIRFVNASSVSLPAYATYSINYRKMSSRP